MRKRIASCSTWFTGASALSIALGAMPALAQDAGSGPGNAAEAPARSYDIPTQPLGSALSTWAEQSGAEVLFTPAAVKGKRSDGLNGTYAPRQALSRLIAGSGLAVRQSSGGSYVVEAPGEPGAAVAAEGIYSESEIVVTGSNIRGVENKTQPLTVISREEIDRTGYATTTQLIESLPQNFALVNQSGLHVPGTAESFPVSATAAQGSSINLRGIGEGTTLTLLNGHRMATGGGYGLSVDISALPLSAIERVDIVTDGASALYGADAVGGVVNFILRRDYDGAETRARYGIAAGGFSEYRASQTFGKSWGTGSVLMSGEYYNRDLLEAADRDFIPANARTGSLLPHESNYGVTFSGHQDLGERLTLTADALYSKRNSSNLAGATPTAGVDYRNATDDESIVAAAGLEWQAFRDWQIALSGNYAHNDTNTVRLITTGSGTGRFFNNAIAGTRGGGIKADGTLFVLPGGKVRAAIGANWRRETFSFEGTSAANPYRFYHQEVRSGYVETYVPLFGEGNALPAMHRLELSLAGRYDSYSNFGSAFSPQLGAMWEPMEGLRLRGSYGTSYKAPNLTDYNTGVNSAGILDGNAIGAPGVVLLQINGVNSDGYKRQRSKSYSIGLEIDPRSHPEIHFGVNYYSIKYSNIIGRAGTIYPNPEYEFLFIRNPTQQQIDKYYSYAFLGSGAFYCDANFDCVDINENFDTSSVNVIADNRRSNLASVMSSGLDVSGRYGFRVGGGSLNVNSTATIVIDRKSRSLKTVPIIDGVGRIYNVPKLRFRSSLGWVDSSVSANVFWNYIGATTDARFVPNRKVAAWSSFDLSLAYDFGEGVGSLLSGLKLGFSATNVFDEKPANIAITNPNSDLGFDPTKGSPLGRLVAFEITKRW